MEDYHFSSQYRALQSNAIEGEFEAAKKAHRKLLGRLNPAVDAVIYTDGSAVPNPGKIGLGVAITFNNKTLTISSPVGIGSILTAELCAIKVALMKLKELIREKAILDCRRTLVFSDCQSAIELVNGATSPSGDFQLISVIQDAAKSVRQTMQLDILWVPAHVGVHGNELANSAAQRGAYAVVGNSPIVGQPPIPLSTSTGLIRNALKERRQRRWLSTALSKQGCEHLTRIKPDISYSSSFFVGSRADQIIMARLRLGSSALNASASRYTPNVSQESQECDCGHSSETVSHFLLGCPKYARARETMIATVKAACPIAITEEVLLGGTAVRVSEQQSAAIVRAVATFARATQRQI